MREKRERPVKLKTAAVRQTAAVSSDGPFPLLIRWSEDGKIAWLEEFGCDIDWYNPYALGPIPSFKKETAPWF